MAKTDKTMTKHQSLYDQATLTGSVHIEVVLRKGEGRTLEVKQVSLKDFPAFQGALDDEPRLIEMTTGEDIADELTEDSLAKVIETIEQVNFPRLRPWIDRKRRRYQALLAADQTQSSGAA